VSATNNGPLAKSTPDTASPRPTKPVVWFPDTSALVTLAVHQPLQDAVVTALSNSRRVLVKAVVAELEALTQGTSPTAGWASEAIKQLEWLGEPVRVDDPVGTELALRFQEQVAAGRPLKHDLEHYGEAAIVALASRARTLAPRMLSDDYDARVLAKSNNVEPISVHRLLFSMITHGVITDIQAADFAEALRTAGRAQDYTAEELRTGRLGRAGRP
jgi:hypothetical protein